MTIDELKAAAKFTNTGKMSTDELDEDSFPLR